NSLKWGPDNRIYGATAGNGGVVNGLNLAGFDFSFDPRERTIRRESGTAQYGLAFDGFGRRFVTSNSRHLRWVRYDQRYVDRSPFYTMPGPLADIAVDGPAAEVYRISPDEPWRVVRTRWRVAGLVRGPVEGGGRVSGYFTAATGLAVYTGDLFPRPFRGDIFVGDAGSNLIHRKKVRPGASGLLAERPHDERSAEFVASTDNWFRPVFLENGPDGALYVADMYREVIEHPWSLPPSIKQHLDLNSGNNRGRIYRIVPDRKVPQPVHLAGRSVEELVEALGQENGWHRRTAARLLATSGDRSAIPRLEKLVGIEALYLLADLNALSKKTLERAGRDSAPAIRRHAARLAEGRTDMDELMLALSRDAAPEVRFQVGLSLGFSSSARRMEMLANVLAMDPENPWIRHAVLGAMTTPEDVGRIFERLPGETAEIMGRVGGKKELQTILKQLDATSDLDVWVGLGRGLKQAGQSLSDLAGKQLEPVIARAISTATNPDKALAARTTAIGFLGLVRDEVLPSLLETTSDRRIREAVIESLGPGRAEWLIGQWPGWKPGDREAAIRRLLATTPSTRHLLTAIEQEKLDGLSVEPTYRTLLLAHPEPDIRRRAEKIFSGSGPDPNELLVRFKPALEQAGDRTNGLKIFRNRCLACHVHENKGGTVGPPRVTFKNAGPDVILLAILDPNREISNGYRAEIVTMKDGSTRFGIVARETDLSMV
ncbi:MAG: PVC-type heme-binding CxxCH protein, partial [Verrucomicrobiota bacterium]